MHNVKKIILCCLVFMPATLVFIPVAYAGVSNTGIQSITSAGRSNAGDVATVENASSMIRNPAVLSRLDGVNTSLSTLLPIINLDIGVSEYALWQPDTRNEYLGDRQTNTGNLSTELLPGPFFYAAYGEEDWGVGVGFTSFHSGIIDYGESDFQFSDLVLDTKMFTLNTNVSAGYQVTDRLSVGAGMDLGYGILKSDQKIGHFLASTDGLFLELVGDIAGGVQNVFPQLFEIFDITPEYDFDLLDGDATLLKFEGDDFAFGWHMGFLYDFSPNTRLGFNYRSKMEYDFEGKYKSEIPDWLFLAAGTNGEERDANVYIPQAAQADLGLWHQIHPDLELHFGVTWQQWSLIDEQVLTEKATGRESLVIPLPFEDSFRYAVGATYTYSDHLKFRAGYSFDEASMPEKDATAVMPLVGNMHNFSVGATYQPDEVNTWDASFTYLKMEDIESTTRSIFSRKLDPEVLADPENLQALFTQLSSDVDLGLLGEIPLKGLLPGIVNFVSEGRLDSKFDAKFDSYLVGVQYSRKWK